MLYSLNDYSQNAKVRKIYELVCHLTLFMKVVKDDLSFSCTKRFS